MRKRCDDLFVDVLFSITISKFVDDANDHMDFDRYVLGLFASGKFDSYPMRNQLSDIVFYSQVMESSWVHNMYFHNEIENIYMVYGSSFIYETALGFRKYIDDDDIRSTPFDRLDNLLQSLI